MSDPDAMVEVQGWDWCIADNAVVPHTSLLRDDEVFLSLPLTDENVDKVQELVHLLNTAL